MHLLSFPPTL